MGLLLSKVLTLLASPIGVAIFLCAVALIVSFIGRLFWARIFIVSAILWLWLSSTPLVANGVYSSLERQYSPVSLDGVPEADAIIVLGGGVQPAAFPRDYPGLNQAGDRILHGARLYKAGKANKIVISGGQVFPDPSLSTEADYSKILLLDWGVPDEAIILEGNSRTTYENGVKTKQLIDREGWQTVLLVTSAAHMPRSMCVFDKAGINSIAAPADYEVVDRDLPFILRLMPSSHAQDLVARGIKEYLGRWVYQWRDWC